ncbi:MAG: M14/M99 family metallopeptidase [bacterium]
MRKGGGSRRVFWVGLGGLLALLWSSSWSWAQGRKHEVHLAGTPYELHVYRLEGREAKSPTMLIIGGIQGDEPGGFLAADRYVDLTLRRGTLLLVPRANFYSIIKNQRGPEGDMNRRFREGAVRSSMDKVVEILKGLMAEADILLNLHDGSGFYYPRWESPQRNPMRFGQSIIADAAVYRHPASDRILDLEAMAQRVIQKVNSQIHEERHHFHFNNHRTLEKDTPHKEQRASATFYALTQHGIPAFGVETSKDIPDSRIRVQYQTMVINAFLDEMGIVADQPPLALDPPQLQYVLISVNGEIPFAVPDKETLVVAPGELVEIVGVVANYQRGITADLEGLGSENDIHKPLKVRKDTRVLVRKESQVFGQIKIKVSKQVSTPRALQEEEKPRVDFFVLDVNGEKRLVENHGRLRVIRGDLVRLVDVLTQGISSDALQVNFIGFVHEGSGENKGEDRGVPIRTARDLIPRYALDENKSTYRIVALEGSQLLGQMLLELEEPKLSYLVVGSGETTPSAYAEGARILVRASEELRILDVRTNVQDNLGVTLELKGSVGSLEKNSHEWILKVGQGLESAGEILVTRDGLPMGRVLIQRL